MSTAAYAEEIELKTAHFCDHCRVLLQRATAGARKGQ
jgi:hypothetical protein